MAKLIAEDASPVIQAGFLVGLRARGATAEELAGFVDHLRERQIKIKINTENLVDLCGTGGGRSSLNLSTGASFLAAAAGAKIAKHGNRAVTSACGSSDLLEALQVSLDPDAGRINRTLNESGIGFFFAPAFHPALKAIGQVRRELGMRTVFNQLGPLLNPARAKRQLIGVYADELLRPMIEALRLLGCEEAYVVRSEDDLDEVSPCEKTYGFHLKHNQINEITFQPSEFGVKLGRDDIAPSGTLEEAAERVERGLNDATSTEFQAFVPNASVCLMLAGLAESPSQASEQVRQAVESGKARRILEDLRRMA